MNNQAQNRNICTFRVRLKNYGKLGLGLQTVHSAKPVIQDYVPRKRN